MTQTETDTSGLAEAVAEAGLLAGLASYQERAAFIAARLVETWLPEHDAAVATKAWSEGFDHAARMAADNA